MSFISGLPLTSAEKRAECLETNSLSSWSRLQSMRLASHERIPATHTEAQANTSKEKTTLAFLFGNQSMLTDITIKTASLKVFSHPHNCYVDLLLPVHWKNLRVTVSRLVTDLLWANKIYNRKYL